MYNVEKEAFNLWFHNGCDKCKYEWMIFLNKLVLPNFGAMFRLPSWKLMQTSLSLQIHWHQYYEDWRCIFACLTRNDRHGYFHLVKSTRSRPISSNSLVAIDEKEFLWRTMTLSLEVVLYKLEKYILLGENDKVCVLQSWRHARWYSKWRRPMRTTLTQVQLASKLPHICLHNMHTLGKGMKIFIHWNTLMPLYKGMSLGSYIGSDSYLRTWASISIVHSSWGNALYIEGHG